MEHDTPVTGSPRSSTSGSKCRPLWLPFIAIGGALYGIGVIMASRGRVIRLLDNFGGDLLSFESMALGFVLPTALGVLILVTIALELAPLPPRVKSLWCALVIGLEFMFLTAYGVAATNPILRLMEKLS